MTMYVYSWRKIHQDSWVWTSSSTTVQKQGQCSLMSVRCLPVIGWLRDITPSSRVHSNQTKKQTSWSGCSARNQQLHRELWHNYLIRVLGIYMIYTAAHTLYGSLHMFFHVIWLCSLSLSEWGGGRQEECSRGHEECIFFYSFGFMTSFCCNFQWGRWGDIVHGWGWDQPGRVN